MFNQFAKREKHLLIILAVTFPILLLIGLPSIIKNELFWLFFYVAPLGFYIATDPERRKVE